jgi:hypothetical protein
MKDVGSKSVKFSKKDVTGCYLTMCFREYDIYICYIFIGLLLRRIQNLFQLIMRYFIGHAKINLAMSRTQE